MLKEVISYMKWSLQQLYKYLNKPLPFVEEIDLSYLINIDPEIIRIENSKIKGELLYDTHQTTVTFNLTGSYVLPCSRTLEEVIVPFSIDSVEIFVDDIEDIDNETLHCYNGHTIDLTPIIEELVLINKPTQVYADDVDLTQFPKGQDWILISEDDFEENANDSKQHAQFDKLKSLFPSHSSES